MELIGRIKDVSHSLSGDTIVSLAVEDGRSAVPGLMRFYRAGNRLSLKIGIYRKKRSLDANAYHWVLCGRMADVLDSDSDSVHYDLMQRYGTILRGEDGRAVIITVRPDVDLRRCNVYARRIGTGHVDGKEFYHYALIKPSREYDSKEMSVLMKGTVQEAKELEIETLTPLELAEMMEALREREWKAEEKQVRQSV